MTCGLAGVVGMYAWYQFRAKISSRPSATGRVYEGVSASLQCDLTRALARPAGSRAHANHSGGSRCPDESTALFLCRKLPASQPAPLLLAGPRARASAGDMDAWLAAYRASVSAVAAADQGASPGCHPDLGGPASVSTHRGRLWLHGCSRSSPGLLGLARAARLEAGGAAVRCVLDATAVAGRAAGGRTCPIGDAADGIDGARSLAAKTRPAMSEDDPGESPGADGASSGAASRDLTEASPGSEQAGSASGPVSTDAACTGSSGSGAPCLPGGRAGGAHTGCEDRPGGIVWADGSTGTDTTGMVAAAAELDLAFNVFVDGVHGCFGTADLQARVRAWTMARGTRTWPCRCWWLPMRVSFRPWRTTECLDHGARQMQLALCVLEAAKKRASL